MTGVLPSGLISSVHIGKVASLTHRGRTIPSAIRKMPVDTVANVATTGLTGDEHGDPVNHGGSDKAICVYPAEHYPYWRGRLDRFLPPGSFGENVTTDGLGETEVCVGDTLTIGSVTLQVSMPRRPCYRLAARWNQPPPPGWVQQTGQTGFYLRVLEPGQFSAGDEIEVIDRMPGAMTVAETNRVMNLDRTDTDAITRLLLAPGLPSRWASQLQRRLSGSLMMTVRVWSDDRTVVDGATGLTPSEPSRRRC